jgi:hypothetical protein
METLCYVIIMSVGVCVDLYATYDSITLVYDKFGYLRQRIVHVDVFSAILFAMGSGLIVFCICKTILINREVNRMKEKGVKAYFKSEKYG